MNPTNPLSKASHSIPVAVLSLLLLSAGMCRQAEEPARELADSTTEEQEALAAARAEAEVEAAERERQAAIAAAEQELAERQARLAAEEERLRQRQALQAERERLEAARVAATERERQLAAREQELRDREDRVAAREEELTREAVDAEDAVPEPSTEPAGVYEGNFDESWREGPATAGAEPADPPIAVEPAPPAVKASLPPGEVLEVQITSTLSSKTSQVGDTFSTRLVRDLYDAEGTLVIPAGAEVLGRVTQAEPYRRGGGQASLAAEFTHVVVPPDQTVGIHASFVELGADRRKNRKKVVAGAVAGAILGHVLGGDGSKNVLIGAAVGAAASGAMVARARDKDAEIPAGQIITLRLEEVVTVEIEYGALAEH